MEAEDTKETGIAFEAPGRSGSSTASREKAKEVAFSKEENK